MTRAPLAKAPKRKRRPRPEPEPMPLVLVSTAMPSRSSWFASGLAHAALIALLVAWGLWAPLRPPAEPVELVLDLTGLPAGDSAQSAADAPTPKSEARKLVPEAPSEAHADKVEAVPAPKHAQQAVAPPAHSAPARPDYEAMLAAREAAEHPREAARLGELTASQQQAAHDAGPDASAQSPTRGGVVGTGSGLSGNLGQRKILEQVQPSYPRAAQRSGVEGDVRLRVYVEADGGVGRVELVKLSGSPEMDRGAIDALRHWRFAPLPEGAAPVTQWGEITLRYRLD